MIKPSMFLILVFLSRVRNNLKHMKKRIYYHDTDCGGVVYYANYLKYMEEARTEYFEERGIFIKELAEKGAFFVVARQEIDYKFPAFYGDTLDFGAVIKNVSRAKIEFFHEIKNQHNRVVCLATTIMVYVDKDIRPKAIEENIREKLLKI